MNTNKIIKMGRQVCALLFVLFLCNACVTVNSGVREAREKTDNAIIRYRVGMLPENSKDGKVINTRLVPNGPAEKAGVRAGDIIISIDGKNIDKQ